MSLRSRLFSAGLAAGLAFIPAAVAVADTSVTASNDSGDSKTNSGDATAHNSGAGFVGQQGGGSTDVDSSDVSNNQATNVQEGDNDLEATQSATSNSGSTIGGQVIGAVVDGDLTVDATNASDNVDLASGDADSSNDFNAFVGLSNATGTSIGAADVVNGAATNVQEGDNNADLTQLTDSSTGDAVGGQIFGATVTGQVDAVLANTSNDSNVESGDSDESSTSDLVSGLIAAGIIEI